MAIKMVALDSFYADDVKQVHGGAEFEVGSEARADELAKKGLAERVGDVKAEKAPANKMAPAPANKRAKPVAARKRRR